MIYWKVTPSIWYICAYNIVNIYVVSDSTHDISATSESDFQKSLNALFMTIEPESNSTSDATLMSPAPLPTINIVDNSQTHNQQEHSPIPSLISALDDSYSPVSDTRSFFVSSSTSHTPDEPFLDDLRQVLASECKQSSLPIDLFHSMFPVNCLSVIVRESSLQTRYVLNS